MCVKRTYPTPGSCLTHLFHGGGRLVVQSVFTAYIMSFISDKCRLHVGQVVIRDKLITR